MKYSININQKAVIENGWSETLSFQHLALLDIVSSIMDKKGIIRILDGEETYYWVSATMIIEEGPLLKLKECRCRQLIDDLCSVGLLKRHELNKGLKKQYIRKGDNYQFLLFDYKKQDDKILSSAIEKPVCDDKILSSQPEKTPFLLDKILSRTNNTNTVESINKSVKKPTGYEIFNKWLLENAPLVLKMKEPITESQYEKIAIDFKGKWDMIKETLESMHNYSGLTKKYQSANLTLRKWVKRSNIPDSPFKSTIPIKQNGVTASFGQAPLAALNF